MSKTGKEIIKALEKISECLKENPEDICKHGSLKRKCEICERDKEIRELKQENNNLKSRLESAHIIIKKCQDAGVKIQVV